MKTILLAEDETLLRDTLAEALQSLPGARYRVVTADSGIRAIEMLGRQRCELLVTDLCMPQVDGFSLLVHVDRHYPRLPVVAMTGYGFPEVRGYVQNLGARLFFEKPFSFATLCAAVDGLLSDLHAEESHISGFSLYSFLQIMEMEKKTALVRVLASGGATGELCFEKGKLVSAMQGARKGTEAVYEMLAWRDPRLRVCSRFEMPVKNVDLALSTLLMESCVSFDETSAAELAGN